MRCHKKKPLKRPKVWRGFIASQAPANTSNVVQPPMSADSRHLVLSIAMSVMKNEEGLVPREFWGLSRSIDLLAPRGFRLSRKKSYVAYRSRLTEGARYPMLRLTTDKYMFSRPLDVYPGVRKVSFGCAFNDVVNLPFGVERVSFPIDSMFNKPIILPPGLLEIKFGNSFDQPLILPGSIEGVSLGKSFNSPLRLPQHVKKIVFSGAGDFDHPITLPETLKSLSLSRRFDQQLSLPAGLKELILSSEGRFSHPLHLPEQIEKVDLGAYNLPVELPDNVRVATFGPNFTQHAGVPSALVELHWNCNQPVTMSRTVKKVVFGEAFQQPFIYFNDGLEEVTFTGDYQHPLLLPSSLKHIHFYHEYDVPLELPPGCERHDDWRVEDE